MAKGQRLPGCWLHARTSVGIGGEFWPSAMKVFYFLASICCHHLCISILLVYSHSTCTHATCQHVRKKIKKKKRAQKGPKNYCLLLSKSGSHSGIDGPGGSYM